MIRRSDAVLIVACLFVALAAFAVHGQTAFDHAGWAGACRQQVSAGFVVHMAELQARRFWAAAGAIASIR